MDAQFQIALNKKGYDVMPVITVLILVIQIAFAIHVVRTGRDTIWIYIILFVPALGCIVYFVTQVLPELGQSGTARKAGNSLIKAIDPQRELRRRKEELEISDTLNNRLQLADECMDAKLIEDAISLYTSCLKGLHDNDPNIMQKLAYANFIHGNSAVTKEILEKLITLNPDYKSTDGHLLYARALENLDLLDNAAKEYEVLSRSFPGEEARVRYGLLLQKMGRSEQAKALFNEILIRGKRSPKYYQKKEKEWIQIAREHQQKARST